MFTVIVQYLAVVLFFLMFIIRKCLCIIEEEGT